jgi:hypothetical protein
MTLPHLFYNGVTLLYETLTCVLCIHYLCLLLFFEYFLMIYHLSYCTLTNNMLIPLSHFIECTHSSYFILPTYLSLHVCFIIPTLNLFNLPCASIIYFISWSAAGPAGKNDSTPLVFCAVTMLYEKTDLKLLFHICFGH